MEKEKEVKNISEEELKAKARKISILEGSAYGPMDGFGIRSITPYALWLGAGNFLIGLLSSLPSLLGNLSQLFSSSLMEKYSRKKIVFWSVFIQALLWLFVLIPGALFLFFNSNSSFSSILLLIIYTLLIIAGSIAGPPWSSWMRDIIPEKQRGRYFGMRNRICGAIALAFALLGGFILDYFNGTKIFMAFVILFFVSFLGRTGSALFIRKQYEPSFRVEEGYYFGFTQFLKKMFYNNFGKFVIFVSLITLTTAICSPFFAVYLLNSLGFKVINFGYVYFFIITISASLTSLIFMPMWGKFSDRFGNIKTMKLTGIIVPFVPILWMGSVFFINNTLALVIYLFVVEAFSGIVWAGFNLAAGNFIYDAVTRQRFALCITYFNILNGFGNFVGAMIGGLISSYSFQFFGLTPILFVFLLSGVARFIVYLFMINKIKEVRDVPNFDIFSAKKRFKFFPNLGIIGYITHKISNPREV